MSGRGSPVHSTSPEKGSVGRTFIREIDDNEIRVHLSLLDLRISSNPETDADRIAELMGLVGELLADVAQAYEEADADYRNWRGKKSVAIAEESTRVAEHTIKSTVEGDDTFKEKKGAVAQLSGDLEFLRAFMDACRAKVTMLNARLAQRRGSGGPGGNHQQASDVPEPTTFAAEPPPPRGPRMARAIETQAPQDRKASVAAAMKRKRTATSEE